MKFLDAVRAGEVVQSKQLYFFKRGLVVATGAFALYGYTTLQGFDR